MLDLLPGRLRTAPVAVATRVLAVALAATMVMSGCGGTEEPEVSGRSPSASDSPPGTGSSTGPSSGPEEPAPDPGYQAPKVGQCYRMTFAQSRASVSRARPVGCRAPHNAVTAYVGYVPRAVTPLTPLNQRRTLGKRVCEPAYHRLVGGTLADRATSILTWTLFTPGQDQLQRGARWVRCDVVARSGNRLIPLPTGQPLLSRGVPEPLRICEDAAGIDVSCSTPHTYRVVAVYRLVGSEYPDAAGYTPVARDRCKELTGDSGGFWQPPSRHGWQAGDRYIRCLSREV
jgi:Septum formation